MKKKHIQTRTLKKQGKIQVLMLHIIKRLYNTLVKNLQMLHIFNTKIRNEIQLHLKGRIKKYNLRCRMFKLFLILIN